MRISTAQARTPVLFRKKWLVNSSFDMSKCISTAQARAELLGCGTFQILVMSSLRGPCMIVRLNCLVTPAVDHCPIQKLYTI
jgi:hypothetical protein